MSNPNDAFDRQVDFGKTAADYGQFRAGFPDEFFDRLAKMGVGAPRQRVLDLGTGTGTLARGFARRGAITTALDRAAPLMLEARRLDSKAGVSVCYAQSVAEQIPLADQTFDVVSAGQCWHWFDRDRAANEVRRLLVSSGRLVIGHFDWIPLPGNVVEATEQLIESHNPAWHFGGGMGLHPQWMLGLSQAGFTDLETFSFDVNVHYSHEAWRGRMRASAGVAATLSNEGVAEFDRQLAKILAERYADEPLQVPHRAFAIVATSS